MNFEKIYSILIEILEKQENVKIKVDIERKWWTDEKVKRKLEKETKKNSKNIKHNSHSQKGKRTEETGDEVKNDVKPKSARGRKKTPQEIREAMLKELENSKLK